MFRKILPMGVKGVSRTELIIMLTIMVVGVIVIVLVALSSP